MPESSGEFPPQPHGSDSAVLERYYRRRLNGDQLMEAIRQLREEQPGSAELELAEQIARERGVLRSDDQ